MNPGIYPDIPFKDYLEIDAVSNSYLGQLEKCPANGSVPQEETTAMKIGSAIHALVLEGVEGLFRDFAAVPSINKRSKAGRAEFVEFQEQHKGKSLITNEESVLIFNIRDSILRHPKAKQILSEGTAEQTIIWKDRETKVLCKGRVDFLPPKEKRVAVDIKTTADASLRAFLNSCTTYGYARQNAFYTDGLNTLEAQPLDKDKMIFEEGEGTVYDGFVFIVVEKKAPFRVELYCLDPDFIARGRKRYKDLLRLHKECKRNEAFPHYNNEGITVLEAPAYY